MKKISLDNVGDKMQRSTIILLSVFALSGGLYVNGIAKNYYLTKYSATTKGATSQFKKSRATATIKNYFVDGNKDTLIVTIGLKENSSTPMPYNATEYVVAVNNKTYKEDVPVLFGRMSTDGDLFLVIPKPKEAIYDIVIANRGYVDYSDTGGNVTTKGLDLDKKSLTKLISENQTFRESGEENKRSEREQGDSIRFRVGIKTAIDDERYKPSILNVDSLLIENGDAVSFDFETFWNIVYKQPLIDDTTKQIEQLTNQIGDLRNSAISLQERLDKNQQDETAQSELSKVQKAIDRAENDNLKLTELLGEYNDLEFNPADFSNYSTTMFSLKF